MAGMARLTVRELFFHDLGPVDFAVGSGERVFITGASGSGKSLFLRALADLDPHRGAIFLDDTACAEIPAPQWRRRVGLLPAESQWWHDTVGEHFPAGLDAEKAGLLGFAPEVAQWSIARLSSGEKQRLAILRLLQNRPEVLLLDEPTANLDPENGARVEELILSCQRERGVAVVWVTHDLGQAARLGGACLQFREGHLEPLAPAGNDGGRS